MFTPSLSLMFTPSISKSIELHQSDLSSPIPHSARHGCGDMSTLEAVSHPMACKPRRNNPYSPSSAALQSPLTSPPHFVSSSTSAHLRRGMQIWWWLHEALYRLKSS